jgi:hypothetical protein
MQERLPRSTGEILSDALALLRRHFKAFYLLALPFCAVDLVLREAAQSALASLRSRAGDAGALDLEATGQMLQRLGAGLGLFVGSALVIQLLVAGLVAMAGEAWRGRSPARGVATGAMLGRGAMLIATTALFWLAIVLLIVLVAVPLGVAAALLLPQAGGPASVLGGIGIGIVALGAFLVGLIALSLRWGIFTQAVVLEGRIGTGAFSRSTGLMAGRGLPLLEGAKFRLSLLFLITFGLSLSLQSLFAIPRLGVAFATGWTFLDGTPPLASMPVWFIVPFGLLEVATNALLVPFGSVLLTLFYFDLRVRYEGLDLEEMAAGAPSEESPPGASPA